MSSAEKLKEAHRALRREEWKQRTPHEQLIAVLAAAQGMLSNIQDRMYSPEVLPEKLKYLEECLEQAQELSKLVRGSWPPPPFQPIPNYGDKLSIEEFTAYDFQSGDDGSGYWATDTEMSRISCFEDRPDWATQVIWFNK